MEILVNLLAVAGVSLAPVVIVVVARRIVRRFGLGERDDRR
jgi:hypothetical protein